MDPSAVAASVNVALVCPAGIARFFAVPVPAVTPVSVKSAAPAVPEDNLETLTSIASGSAHSRFTVSVTLEPSTTL